MGKVVYFPTGNTRQEDDYAVFRKLRGDVVDAPDPVAVLEYFLALAKQDRLRFLAIAATLSSGQLLHAELGLVTDDEPPSTA